MRGVKTGTKRGTYSKHIYVKDIVEIITCDIEINIINDKFSVIYRGIAGDILIDGLLNEYKELRSKEVINIEVWDNTLAIFVI